MHASLTRMEIIIIMFSDLFIDVLCNKINLFYMRYYIYFLISRGWKFNSFGIMAFSQAM